MLRLPIITVLFIMFMHQSIPPAPSPPPPGNCRAFARLVSPRSRAFANFALSGGRAFANSRAIPELLTRSRSHQNITTKKVLLEKKSRLARL